MDINLSILKSRFLSGLFFSSIICCNAQTMENKENWKEKLTPEQYKVLFEKGTEKAFTGKLLNNKEDGSYNCAACQHPLFSSDAKFDSGSGWPSFFDISNNNAISEIRDTTHGMLRIEITCANCGGHLGHVFNDGPQPTGLRYCVNSLSLEFKKEED